MKPEQSLEAAQAVLHQAELRLAQLAGERTAALQGDDYAAAVAKIEIEIGDLTASITAHRGRIAVLEERQRDDELAERGRMRIAGVAAVRKKLPARLAAAKRLDAAMAEVAAALAELERADGAVFASWPDVLPPADRLRYLRITNLDSLSTVRKHRVGYGPVRELAMNAPYNIAEIVDSRNSELAAELERVQTEVAA
jgi:hypothetical protein